MILIALEANRIAAKNNGSAENNHGVGQQAVSLMAKKRAKAQVVANKLRTVAVLELGLGMSVLCALLLFAFVLAAVLFPPLRAAQTTLSVILPGFSSSSGWRVLLGLVESFAWGWYLALIVGGLYNFAVTRRRR